MAKRTPAGERRHVVSIEDNASEGTYDSYGQVSAASSDWTTSVNDRAKIETLSGDEGILARQIYPNASKRVTIDYHSTMMTTGATRRRVKFGSRYLYVGAVVNPDEENVELQLLCGEEL